MGRNKKIMIKIIKKLKNIYSKKKEDKNKIYSQMGKIPLKCQVKSYEIECSKCGHKIRFPDI
jgi:transcription elongation factor Elf1